MFFAAYFLVTAIKTKALSMCVHSVIFFTRTTVVRMADKKLSDDEKIKLIQFYRDNAELWDSANPYYKNKVKQVKAKNV